MVTKLTMTTDFLSFIIIGMQRSGTTSLLQYLSQNPRIQKALKINEPHFFDYDHLYNRGVDWYKRAFYNVPLGWCEQGIVYGENSPTLLHCKQAPSRVARDAPHVKLLVCLRNPIDRAYSHWCKARDAGYEREADTFEMALEMEADRLAQDAPDAPFYLSNRHLFAYVQRGHYVDHLERWLAWFPRKQFMILQSEKFWADTDATIKRVSEWLGVPFVEGHYENKCQQSIKREPMRPDTRAELLAHYAPYNRRLGRLLGREFGGWDE